MEYENKIKIVKAFLSILAVLIIWQTIFKSEIIPAPLDVLKSFLLSLKEGYLIIDILTSIKRVFVGFFIGGALGITLGTILAISKKLSDYIIPLVELVRPIPPIAWIPISILWFGVGNLSAFFLVALGAFFPIFSNTYDGIKNVKNIKIKTALNFGASRKQIISHVLLPGSLPSIFTGFRISLGIVWMIVITAELVGATSGLGYMIQLNRILLQTDNVIMGMIVIGIIGYLMNKLMIILEKKIIRWSENAE